MTLHLPSLCFISMQRNLNLDEVEANLMPSLTIS